MKSLKSIWKANLSKDSFDVIFWGQPTTETFNDAVAIYQSSNRENKKNIQERAFRKLYKQKQPHIVLAILHLFDCLLGVGVPINLSESIPKIDLSNCSSQKQIVSDKSFYELYYKFLRFQSLKPTMLLINTTNIDENLVNYCEMAEESISLVLQMDFLILHCIKNSKHPIIVNMVVASILRRVREDMGFLNQFLSENWQLILRKHPFSFNINHIYEKTIFLSRQIHRIQLIANKMTFSTQFPTYKFDSAINKAIQMEMNRRQDEKRQFLSEKMIKSPKEAQENGNFFDIASQNSILIDNDEFQK